MKLEELERRLRTDIMQEAIAWAGRVMLHKEVSLDTPAAREISFEEAATPSACSPNHFPSSTPHLMALANHKFSENMQDSAVFTSFDPYKPLVTAMLADHFCIPFLQLFTSTSFKFVRAQQMQLQF